MSAGDINQVMIKIRGATTESPIAVFNCDKVGMLDAVFASTVMSQRRIRKNDKDLIGVYDNTMNLDEVQSQLKKHVRKL